MLKSGQRTAVALLFPFTQFFSDAPQPLFPAESYEADLEIAEGCFRYFQNMFKGIEECHAFELLRNSHDRGNYLITTHARIIAMTCTHAALTRSTLVGLNFKYDNLIMEESAQVLEVETFIPMLLQQSDRGVSRLKRVMFIGDHHQLPPVVKNRAFQKYGHLDQSLYARFVRLRTPTVDLNLQGRARPAIADLYSWRYKDLGNLENVLTESRYRNANAGLTYDYQFVDVEDFDGKGETQPTPYFYQNLGEAEYCVATFMYMRLLGYPASKISILSTYNGQKALIRDVIKQRCAWNPLFGEPNKITTVDRFQGQQNDFIIVSLVRTSHVGHLRDVRRLIVTMSRARFGLYVFGRFSLFENCFELTPVFSRFAKRPRQLSLELDERPGSDRKAGTVENPTLARDLHHMWALVQEKMKAQFQEAAKVVTAGGGSRRTRCSSGWCRPSRATSRSTPRRWTPSASPRTCGAARSRSRRSLTGRMATWRARGTILGVTGRTTAWTRRTDTRLCHAALATSALPNAMSKTALRLKLVGVTTMLEARCWPRCVQEQARSQVTPTTARSWHPRFRDGGGRGPQLVHLFHRELRTVSYALSATMCSAMSASWSCIGRLLYHAQMMRLVSLLHHRVQSRSSSAALAGS